MQVAETMACTNADIVLSTVVSTTALRERPHWHWWTVMRRAANALPTLA
jgi:hypothetical protein